MRFGETAQSIRLLAEEKQQGKRPLHGQDQGLAQAEPDVIRLITGEDDDGNAVGFFVLGLHSPDDTNPSRIIGS